MPHSKLKKSSWKQPVSAQPFWPDLQGLLLQDSRNRRRERQTVLDHVIRGDLSDDLPIASRPTPRSQYVRNKRSALSNLKALLCRPAFSGFYQAPCSYYQLGCNTFSINGVVCSTLSLPTAPHCAKRADSDGCSVQLCSYSTKIRESIHLIRLGARIGLVSQLTSLEKTTVKRLYHQLCGKPSPPGQMPFTDVWYRENDRRMLHATLVWRLHRRLTRTRRGAARVRIDLFEAYTQLKTEPLLDITRTAFVPHLVTMGTWHERLCEFCKMHYLSPVESNSIACPGCRLYYRYRCPHCHAPLVPQSKGRRRTTCGHCGSKLKIGIQE